MVSWGNILLDLEELTMSTNDLIAMGMMMGVAVVFIIVVCIFVYFDDRARAREKSKIKPENSTPMYTSVTKSVPLKAGEDAEVAAERIFNNAVREQEANVPPGMFSTVTVTVEPAIGTPVTRTKTTEPKVPAPEKESTDE